MEEKITPMMQQWHACKAKSKNALLLFRLGDFYEAFYEDAKILSEDVEVTLTKRGEIPMSGIPAHTLENYLDVLINKGRLIAIAEQVEDPRQTKGIVKRDIVRLLSKGAIYSPSLLSDKKNNFFVSICVLNSRFGIAAIDLTTAECKTLEATSPDEVINELYKLCPSELLLSEKAHHLLFGKIDESPFFSKPRMTIKSEWHFDHALCLSFLVDHFKVHNLDGFGLKGFTCAANALGSLLMHLKEELHTSISHIVDSSHLSPEDYLVMDPITQRHLDLFSSTSSSVKDSSLLYLLDQTSTPMGGRLLKEWMCRPLQSLKIIALRQDAIEFLINGQETFSLIQELKKIKDIERMILRLETGHHCPKDLLNLKDSLAVIPTLLSFSANISDPLLKSLFSELVDLSELTDLIDKTLTQEALYKSSEGNLIRSGIDSSLDELKTLKTQSEDFLISYQEKLKQETGIKTLKVGFSKAFGYFIDISRGQASKVPHYFHKRQTLVNNERFVTQELQEFQDKILHAEENILILEEKIYKQLAEQTVTYSTQIKKMSGAVAACDVLLAFAQVAKRYDYVKPTVDESFELVIEEGRHPILEQKDFTSSFIPNDTMMNQDDQRLYLITGPNMAGKSTYIRQVALITYMAHLGSFVPAKKAHIGRIDRIFTRIGASDDLSRGQSTFMVEMAETAHILRHATDRSLIILDEIGRGTSTYDGISIAWAVADYLLTAEGKQAKTLFATHYCELTELEEKYKEAKNYHIAVQETAEGIVFLRKILRGGADKSYGIHVAKLAGLPLEVIQKAHLLLKNLEAKSVKQTPKKGLLKKQEQLFLFEPPKKISADEEVLDELKKIEIEQLTPLQALILLEQFKKQLKQG